MSYAFEISVEDLPEGTALNFGRASIDGKKIAYRSAIKSFEGAKEIAKNIDEYSDYLKDVANGYTRIKTEAELKVELDQVKQSHTSQVNRAVSQARVRNAENLPFQAKAYEEKEADAKAWSVGDILPASLIAVKDRFNTTDQQTVDLVLQSAESMRALLSKTEQLRDKAKGHIDRSEFDAVKQIIAALNGI